MKGKKSIRVLILLLLVAVTGAGTYTVLNSKETKKIAYETQLVRRGTIEETVSSTGTIQAKGSVEVLTQLTGTIEAVYVDFNDRVWKGQLLAELEKSMLLLSLREQEAALRKAKAKAEEAQATYEKNLQLQKRNLLSEADLLSSKTSLESAKADLESSQVAYEKARLNLEQYAKILSPINGIVLERNIDKGQTVVANSGSVTRLFTLAENLENLEIYAQVDEIDIGKIREGQEVRFTVEAFPDRKFTGKVRQIRKMPTTSNNIVNYTVVIDSKNPDNLLLPGLAATVEFFVNRKENVLMVPNLALKFSPPEDVAAAFRRKQFEERIAHLPQEEKEKALREYDEAVKKAPASRSNTQVGVLGGMPPMPGVGRPPANRNNPGRGVSGGSLSEGRFEGKPIWILEEDGNIGIRYVQTGITDGKFTEVVDGSSLEGLQVIVRMKP